MRNLCLILSLACLTTAVVAPAIAKTVPAAEAVARASDVFVGQDRPGPYTLAWKNLRPDAVVVAVDGATLPHDAYTLDAVAGTVTFKTPLKPQAVARVDYAYDPLNAVRNEHPAAKPFTVSLFDANGRVGSAGLQVTALPGDPKNSATAAPLLVWGLNGKANLFGGGFSSQILLAPDEGGALADQAGMRLGYGITTDRAKLEASFVRAGSGFAPQVGKSFGLAEQAQRWTLAGQATPAQWVAAEFRLAGARDLTGKGSSDGSLLKLRFLGTGALPVLNLARAEDTKQTADGAATSVINESANLAGKVGLTTFTAQGRRVTTDAPDAKNDQTKQDASLSLVTATKDSRAQAAVTIVGGSVETAAGVAARQSVEVTTKVQAAPTLTVAAEARRAEDSKSGATEGSTAVTSGKVNVTGTVGQAAVALQGQRIVSEGMTPDKDQTRQEASLALSAGSKDKKALASVALTGGTVETAAGIEAKQGVTVKLQPAPVLTLSAEARLQTLTPADVAADGNRSLHQSASAELKPFTNTTLTGSLRVQGEGEARASVTEFSAQTQPLRFLLIAGGQTRRNDTGADLLDTTRARVTLRPAAGISLTGGLTINPEDKGRITEAMRQEYGLAARIGALDLGGGYTLTTLAAAAVPVGLEPQSGELSLNLGLRFSRYTSLTGGYKDAFLWGGLESRGIRAVSLGLNHNVGSAVNFSLVGTQTEDKGEIGRPADLKADLKLGLKF